jgi:transmembrane sensor
MKKNKMERIVVKYLINQATPIEIEKLLEWLRDPTNILTFNSYVKVNYAADYEMKKFDLEKAKKEILRSISQDKKFRIKRKRYLVLKFAAVLVLLIGIGSFFIRSETATVQVTDLINKNDDVILELEDGTIVSLDPEDSTKIKNVSGKIIGNQKHTQLVYASSNKNNKIEYNTLKVPYGKRFNVTLSDGTIVYLNAGSSLKYPVSFLEGKIRKVFLSGEAYFDVFSDIKHPFIVNVNDINVKALGTEFNIKGYPEDKSINTVLVQGTVKVYEKGKEDKFDSSIIIKPNSMAMWDRMHKSVIVKKVDSKIYTSWLKDKLIFRNIQFNEIRKVLERHYNVKIINKNKLLDEQQFDATFNIETIDEVLNSFSSTFKIEYKIKDNVIIINENRL